MPPHWQRRLLQGSSFDHGRPLRRARRGFACQTAGPTSSPPVTVGTDTGDGAPARRMRPRLLAGPRAPPPAGSPSATGPPCVATPRLAGAFIRSNPQARRPSRRLRAHEVHRQCGRWDGLFPAVAGVLHATLDGHARQLDEAARACDRPRLSGGRCHERLPARDSGARLPGKGCTAVGARNLSSLHREYSVALDALSRGRGKGRPASLMGVDLSGSGHPSRRVGRTSPGRGASDGRFAVVAGACLRRTTREAWRQSTLARVPPALTVGASRCHVRRLSSNAH